MSLHLARRLRCPLEGLIRVLDGVSPLVGALEKEKKKVIMAGCCYYYSTITLVVVLFFFTP